MTFKIGDRVVFKRPGAVDAYIGWVGKKGTVTDGIDDIGCIRVRTDKGFIMECYPHRFDLVMPISLENE